MIEKIKNSAIIFWLLAIPTLVLTGLLTLLNFSEYYTVAIKKDIKDYPFGKEGPVAANEYYQTADLYAKHMLTSGLCAAALSILTLYLVIKRKTIGLLVIMTVLMCYVLYNFLTASNE